MAAQRFPLRFSTVNRRVLGLLGIRPRNSYVEIGDDELVVRMAWAYRAAIPLSAVQSAVVAPDVTKLTTGAHGFRGRWLVNGDSKGIVKIAVDPPARGWTMIIPVRIKELQVSMEDPDGLVLALSLRG